MASKITQNAITSIYDYLFRIGKLIGTSSRPNIISTQITDAIYNGIGFDVSGTGTIASGASASFMAIVGDTSLHFHGFEIKSSAGLVTVELFEAPTTSANGTAKTPLNKNRNSTTVSKTLVYMNPTITANGTLLATRQILQVGGGAHIEGGEASISSEWILKPNTKYIIKITNSSGGSINFSSSFYYYEK